MYYSKLKIYFTSPTDIEHEFIVNFSFGIDNDGIGSYEYWGCKGFDKGEYYADFNEFEDIFIVKNGVNRLIDINKMSEANRALFDKAFDEKYNKTSLKELVGAE